MDKSVDTQQQTKEQSANKIKGLQLAVNNLTHRKAQGYYVFPQQERCHPPFIFKSLLELGGKLFGARKTECFYLLCKLLHKSG